ncbi:MAG: V-type ATPase subunit [bacterium]
MIKGTDDCRYAFVNGIVRAKEARLLKKSHFERLIDANIENFNPILSDTVYTGTGDLTGILNRVEIEERRFFEKYCLHPEIKQVVFLPEAIHNLKVRLKNGDKNLLYNIDTRELESSGEVIKIIDDYLKHRNSFVLCTELDKFLCKKLYELSQVSQFFYEYFQLYFDLENIRSFFRSRQFENPSEIFKQVYIEYGTIAKEKYMQNLTKSYDVIIREFRDTRYGQLIEQGSAYLKSRGSFLKLERLVDEMKLQFLRIARFYTFGIEPLFGYYQFRMAEIRKLRQVYMGKKYNIPSVELKESIPDVW